MQALTVFSGEKPLIVFPHNPERLVHQKMCDVFFFLGSLLNSHLLATPNVPV